MKNWLKCLTILIVILVQIMPSRPVQSKGYEAAPLAANASCGEPERTIGTLTYDLCLLQTFNYNGTDKKVIVYFTLTRGTAPDRLANVDTNPADGVNDIAANVAQWTEEAWRTYLDYGFGDPLDRNDMDVYLYDMRPGLLGWCCGERHYEFDAPHAVNVLAAGADPRDGAATAFHEMWHATEWSGKGGWIDEGTASNMSDHVNLPVDTDSWNDYISRVTGYLGGGRRQSLTAHAYDAALWWTYYLEQAGTITSEPNRGVDAMLQFWQNLGADGLTSLDTLLQGLPGGRSLESTWIDFTVANYAKELTGPGVPVKYQYQDELQAGSPNYPAVSLDVSRPLGVTDSVIATADVQSWAARYYEFRPDPAVPIFNIEFRQDTNRRLGYTLLLIRNNDIVQEIRQVGRDFLRSFANNSFDRVVIIVTGLSDYANYRYSINGTQPILNIVDPLISRKALAGDPLAPGKILVKAEVLSPSGGGTPVAGIDPNAFTITIGSQVVPTSQYVSSAYIQGQYWILLRAPTQATTGFYDLRIDFGPTLTDTETAAVSYAAVTTTDNSLIIDHSLSMADFQKIQAAKDAGRLYVDSWRIGDKIAVISFNQSATVNLSLRDLDATSRSDALTAINGLVADGATSIGDGLTKGLDELIARGNTADEWAMVVLSDGMENQTPFIQDFMNTYKTRKDNHEKVPRVYTVALGADADRARMEKLANDTGGTYQYASEPSASALAPSASITTLADLPNDLAEIYRVIGETVARQQQIYSERSVIPSQQTASHKIFVENGASEAVFVVNWSDLKLSDLTAQLIQPDGTPIPSPTLTDNGHFVWRVPTPMGGEWLLNVSRELPIPLDAQGEDAHVLVEAAVKSDLTMDVFLGLPVEERLAGRPMPILVSLSDNQPILGATVSVRIVDPNDTIWSLPLYDDGLHSDGNSNDGFYGNTFYRTSLAGSYVAVVSAHGTSTLSGSFVRRLRTSFNMDAAPDTDKDGIPDWADPNPGQADPAGDPDEDGLTNVEEFEAGTDPLDSDSDNGGESDGSEADQGTDPLDPGDDQIACMLDFQAMNVLHERDDVINPQASVLLFSVDPSHDHFIVWRATDPAGPWQLLDDQVPPTGQYIDHQVTLGVTYYYRLQAVDTKGRTSCIVGPRGTTPKADSIPPDGIVLINDGAQVTSSPDVTLTLEASADTVEMIISNDPNFAGANWEPYQTSKPWTLAQSLGLATVFVKYRDADANESDVAVAGIEIKPLTDLQITKAASSGAHPGESLTYTLTVTNKGPSDATGVTVTDTLPAEVAFTSATSSLGSCSESGGVVTCTLGNLANGESASITIETIVAATLTAETITNTATVTGNETDTDTTNNTASAESPVITLCSVLDDFNRTDGPLGNNWNGRTSGYRIRSNQVAVRASGPIYWQPDTLGPDQEACVTLRRINPKSRQHALLLKVQESNNWRKGAILVSYNARSGKVDVKARDVVNHKWILAGSFVPSTPVKDGDQLRAQAFTDGTVKVFINDVSIGTADAGSFYAGKGGQIGLWFRTAQGSNERDDDDDERSATSKKKDDDDEDRSPSARRALLDDFGGGTLTAPAPTPLSCLDLQALTPFPLTYSGPTFALAPLDFTNPVDQAGMPMPIVLEDRLQDLDGKPELWVGFSSDAVGFKPLFVEFPSISFPNGVSDVLVQLRQFASATVMSLDQHGTIISSATQPTQNVRVDLKLPGSGIRKLQFNVVETMVYQICWVP